MKENVKMMLEQNNQLENELKKKDELIEQLRNNVSSSSDIQWKNVKDKMNDHITSQISLFQQRNETEMKSNFEKKNEDKIEELSGESPQEETEKDQNQSEIEKKMIEGINNEKNYSQYSRIIFTADALLMFTIAIAFSMVS